MSRNGARNGAVRVLLVDDHPVVRRGLRDVLSAEPGLEICGEAADPREAMKLLSEVDCDLAILDVSLKGPSGLELIRQLRSRYPRMAILVCTMHDEALFAERALRAGARGYVQKQENADQVLTAVRRILDGHFYLSSAMTDRLLGSAAGTGNGTEENPVFRLTGRELEVFELLGHARGTRQIAEQLHLSPKTVESHRENIKRKLDLANHNELMRSAVQWVLEHDGSP
jgi:DNA-binding NarL/FixJ family response regulator